MLATYFDYQVSNLKPKQMANFCQVRIIPTPEGRQVVASLLQKTPPGVKSREVILSCPVEVPLWSRGLGFRACGNPKP